MCHLRPLPTPVGTGASVQLNPRLLGHAWAMLYGYRSSAWYSRASMLLQIQTLTHRLTSQFNLWPVSSLRTCLEISGLCLIMVTLTGPDPNLWIDIPAWPQICLVTMNSPDDTHSWLNKSQVCPLASLGHCGAEPWLARPLHCQLVLLHLAHGYPSLREQPAFAAPLTQSGNAGLCSPLHVSFGMSHLMP